MPPSIGRYRVLGELGRGAMGVVYRGLDETLDREVALKVLSAAHASDKEARGRFLREGRAAGRLQHPNIVTVFELGEHEGAPFIAMELLEGRDLQQAIRDGLRPDPRVTLPIVLQVLAGLGHAHEHGIVHRDIKPSNIFLPRGLSAKITDFGIARLSTSVATAMTRAGTMMGTPNYMSPEQVKAAKVDARSDLFSAGLILYELVTGEKAYQADSVVSVLFKIVQGPPDLALIPRSPEWARLRDVLERALKGSPDDRYPDARTMAQDLSLALSDLGGAATTGTTADRAILTRTRRPGGSLARDGAEGVARGDWSTGQAEPWRGPTELGDASVPSTPSPALEHPRAAAVPAPLRTPAPRLPGSRSIVPVLAAAGAGVVLFAVAGFLGWRVLAPRLSTATASLSVPATTRAPSSSLASPTPFAPETRTPPATRPAATFLSQPSAPPSPRLVAAPVTAEPPYPTPTVVTTVPAGRREVREPAVDAEERLARADVLFEQGKYARALAEARAVLQRDPANADARNLVEDAEAAIAVETALKNAREAIRRGDRETALVHVRNGLAVSATDSRLIALFRELQR